MADHHFEVILFDLGGVLIELGGIARMLEWTKGTLSIEQLFRQWLSSSAVRKFESGRSTPEEFAVQLLTEFNLPVEPVLFLKEFADWPSAVYPNAISLLESLSDSLILASLSNTNQLHWHRISQLWRLSNYFHFNFASHEIGMLKPDPEVFRFVVNTLARPAKQILFFDDNQMNVDSAQACGMVACKVSGVTQVTEKLREFGLF